MADGDGELQAWNLDVSSSSSVKDVSESDSPESPPVTMPIMEEQGVPVSSTSRVHSYCDYLDSYHSDHTDKESSPLISPVRKYKKLKNQKYCLVCGDRALGYNFNAVTCESCKAFFRRNALKNQLLKCLFQGNCSIDLRTRRFCPFCRLNKCYEIGMKKEMILDDSERKARMQKVCINRARKRVTKEDFCDESPDSAIIKDEPLSDPEPETCMKDIEMSQVSSCGSESSSTTCISKQSEKAEMDIVVKRSMLPSDPSLYRTLTDEEKKLISDLTMSYKETLASYAVEQHLNQEENYSSLNDLVNNSEIAVRRLIKFVKLLSDFKKLSQENQIAALKACVLYTLLLRSVNFYDVENDAWLTPTGNIPSSVLKQATGYHDLHEAHTSYCRSLKAITQDDEYIMAILQVMLIFRPDGLNLQHRHQISDLQDKYFILLKHYLESSFSYMHAHIVLTNLLRKFNELQKIGDDHAKIILQLNPGQIEPLMLEVLNLN